MANIYSTLEEKKNIFKSICAKYNGTLNETYWQIDEISALHQFIDYMDSQSRSTIYRGVNNASYKIYSALQRRYIMGKVKEDITPSDFIDISIRNLREKQNSLLSKYYSALGVLDSDWQMISHLQHYGAPTPFIDFARTLYPSLYFAKDGVKNFVPQNDITDYISLYWMDLNAAACVELGKDALENHYRWYVDAVTMVLNHLLRAPKEQIDTTLLNIENFFKWKNNDNMGEGLCKIPLAYMNAESFDEQSTVVYSPHYVKNELEKLKRKAMTKTIKQEDCDQFLAHVNSCIQQNIKLINLNLVAQDGSFFLFNPDNVNWSLEDYWLNNTTYRQLPTIHCANIHKSLCTEITKLLKQNQINKQAIYPSLRILTRKAYNDLILK